MIYNYLGTTAFILVLWLIGQVILKLSRLSELPYKNLHFISIPLGISVCAVVADLFYLRLGTSVAAVRIAYAVLAILAIVVLARYKIRREELIGLIWMFVIFNIMLLPGLFAGDKYYVHRGNIWDQYFYLAEVIYMSIYKMKDAAEGVLSAVNIPDVYSFGYAKINSDRPTAPLLCAVLAGKGWGDIFFQAYLFIVAVWMSVFGSMMFAMEMLFGRVKAFMQNKKYLVIMNVLCFAYVWGFFGQIQFDINAWSQMVSMSGLIAFVCIYFCIFEKLLEGEKALDIRTYLVLLVLGTGLFLIYPENTMIHGAFIVVVSFIVFMTRKSKISLKTVGIMVTLPLFILGISALLDYDTVRFALHQVGSSSSDTRQSWAAYFDEYWLGYHPFIAASPTKETVKKLIAFLPSLFGMFIVTPNYEVRILPITILWLGAVALLAMGILILLGKYIPKAIRYVTESAESNRGYLGLLSYVGIFVFILMMMSEKYWSAGKLFLYISPYIYLLMLFPLSDAFETKISNIHKGQKKGKKKIRKISRIQKITGYMVLFTSAIFIICQVTFAGMMFYDVATNNDCTGYLGNYPSDQMPYLKQCYPYNFNAKKYTDEEVVAIKIDDPWYQDYVKLSLAYEGISYYAVPDSDFNKGKLKKEQSTLTDGDTIIGINETY